MGLTRTPTKCSSAREHFFELQRRDLGLDQNGSKTDLNRSCGTIVAKVNRFNPAMDRMKGMTLINKGEEEWLFEVEGDPSLIDRRLGGKPKRPRDKGAEGDYEPIGNREVNEVMKSAQHPVAPGNTANTKVVDDQISQNPQNMGYPTVVRATRTPKRTRVSDPLGLGPALAHSFPENLNEGPCRNTRSKASVSARGRGAAGNAPMTNPRRASGSNTHELPGGPEGGRKWKGKSKGNGECGGVAEITAGIDGFSVFSNHQLEGVIQPSNIAIAVDPTEKPTAGMDAGDWAHSVTHSVKVGVWLEETAEAGSQAPVDAPKSRAPSTIAGLM